MAFREGDCKVFPAVAWGLAVKSCDACKSGAAQLFCRADSAFLCRGCDTRIHVANKVALRHERVWLCEVCEHAPASVTCKADAAALCVTCDRDIHSANPLARRHERVPVVPFCDSADSATKSVADNFFLPTGDDYTAADLEEEVSDIVPEEAEAAPWILPNSTTTIVEQPDIKSVDFLFADIDPFGDFEYANSVDLKFEQLHSSADSVVPVQTKAFQQALTHNQSSDNCFDTGLCRSKLCSYNSFTSRSLSHSVSTSSMDIGVVPEGHSISEASYPFVTSSTLKKVKQTASFDGNDREARVLRYREKRKNRKFEKTIRYASRKAYAETRPRIKGRFAKRTESESDMERIYPSTAFRANTIYGVVPT